MRFYKESENYIQSLESAKELVGDYYKPVIFHCFWGGELSEKQFISILSCFHFNVNNKKNRKIILWHWHDVDYTQNIWFTKISKICQIQKFDFSKELKDTDLPPELNSHLRVFPWVTDRIRYLLLYKYGGMWFDLDNFFLRDFDPIFENFENDICVYPWADLNYPNNAIYISLKKLNPKLKEIINFLKERNMSYGFQESQLTTDTDVDILLLPCPWFDISWYPGYREIFSYGKDFFKKSTNVYTLDTFCSGAFCYHWHNKWDEEIEVDSQFDQLKRDLLSNYPVLPKINHDKNTNKTMKLLDGKIASKRILSEVKIKIEKFRENIPFLSQPKIAIVLIGDNPSSRSYVTSKIKTCESMGIQSQLFFYPSDVSEKQILEKITQLNNSKDWDGYIIEMPLPSHIDKQNLIECINPDKDIDGFHPLNFGKMALGQKSNRPATAYGILKLLEFYKISTEGKHIVVIGRSDIVGKPISIMLGNDFDIGRGTVTTCDKNTPVELLKSETTRADIIIVAAGKPNLLTQDMVKEGSIVIDVGINIDSDGNVVGDCDFENLSNKCEWITPVPGGVGPMTICALILNTFESWKQKNSLKESDLENKNQIEHTIHFIEQTDIVFESLKYNRALIGTYDHNRKPKDPSEIIQIIGDYPTGKHSLLTNNPTYRHYKWALKFPYDHFEGDPCWDPIDVIYIINDPERQDRLYDTLKEFKKMGVPLDKVKIQPAQYDNSTGNPYANRLIGCFKSHLMVFESLLQSNYDNMLVFEDDFTFSDPMEDNKKQLTEFFSRKYDYDVLLLSTSAVGKIVPKDDLISMSMQECTTASGYVLSRKGLEKVYPLWKEGINGLLYNCDYNYYACDRYWTRIQKDNQMYTFNRKIGYQRPAYSTTLRTMTYYLD